MRISVEHHVTALIFYNITRCYGKHVAVFAIAVATGDIIKYQSFVYGSFVWEIHVRYNKTCMSVLIWFQSSKLFAKVISRQQKSLQAREELICPLL